ncbi:MAG: thioredoxin fold domain-containing protein, partial [Chitinophagaceae bacterium]|nr:thioredoxin fold domain-containing protein [Chitinophagaceae bacterium]
MSLKASKKGLLELSLIILAVFPVFVYGQENISGIWKVREVKYVKGGQYTNGVPILMRIQQTNVVTEIEITNSMIDHDTVFSQRIKHGGDQFNESITTSGKRKTVTMSWESDSSRWLKKSIIFEKDTPLKITQTTVECFYPNGSNHLTLKKSVEVIDDVENEKDYTIFAYYEKLTEEQLAWETAKGSGVEFISNHTWQQLLKKAKKESKYIFVDCYATWCAPCKVMDRDVFSLNVIGDYFNRNFISIKVQLDTTKNDAYDVKQYFSLARKFEKEYSIISLPTYLIFSPQGKIVHKIIGQHKPTDFLTKIKESTDPQKQIYTLYDSVYNKQIPFNQYRGVARKLRRDFGEEKMAVNIARLYQERFVNNLKDEEILNKENLDFAGVYIGAIQTKDKIFSTIYRNRQLADSIMERKPIGSYKNSWSYDFIVSVLRNEIINPQIKEAIIKKVEPNWQVMDDQLNKIIDR